MRRRYIKKSYTARLFRKKTPHLLGREGAGRGHLEVWGVVGDAEGRLGWAFCFKTEMRVKSCREELEGKGG